jgi:hypothetical protein
MQTASFCFSSFVFGFVLAQTIYTHFLERDRDRQNWYRERWIELRDSDEKKS